MSNSKKIISLLLSVIMIMSVITIVPFTAGAVEANTAPIGDVDEANPDFSYYVNNEGKAVITGYNGKGGDVSIPSTLGGYPVTSIGGEAAFRDCTSFTTVDIPDSVTSIGFGAFMGCTELTSVTLGNAVTNIDGYAFYKCSSLTDINIPDSVTSIGDYAFYDCHKLNRINSSGSVTNIGRRAYDGTAWYYNQPDGLIYIGKAAYAIKGECPSEVVIKDGTENIIGSAFSFSDLTSIDIPDSVTSIGDYAFYQCTGLTNLTIGNSVTSIGDYAFYNCCSLTNIDIPNSVTNIGFRAFSYCRGLTSVTIPNSFTSINEDAFLDCTGLTSVTIPDSVTSIGREAFLNCTKLTEITIPDSVTTIEAYAVGYKQDEENDLYRLAYCDYIIYGYEGSAAETYASENYFTFIKLTDHQDEASGVIASVTDGVELRVADVLDQMPADTIKAYDISLLKNGEPVQPEHVVSVKIPCDDPDAKVYRKEADGSLTDMNAVYQDGYLSFKTTHFSVYIVATGAEVDIAICGDADGDGEVTVNDATFIQRYLVGSDISIDPAVIERNCDVDGDGKVNVIDVTLIQRKLAGLPVRYPIGEAL